MSHPIAIQVVMIKALKQKAIEEQDKADEFRALMYKYTEKNPFQAGKASEQMFKHQYAAGEFRKMAAQMEKKK